LFVTTITRVAAFTSVDLSQNTATQTQSAIITENSDGLYKFEDKLSGIYKEKCCIGVKKESSLYDSNSHLYRL